MERPRFVELCLRDGRSDFSAGIDDPQKMVSEENDLDGFDGIVQVDVAVRLRVLVGTDRSGKKVRWTPSVGQKNERP